MYTAEEKRLRHAVANKAWRERNPDKVKLWSTTTAAKLSKAAWYARNPDYNSAYFVEYNKVRRQVDPLYKLTGNLRCLVNVSFKVKAWGKTTKTQQLLGCTFEELAKHLQSKFKDGMTLENYGEWHIDHIKPCATATSPEELAALFHYTNLQPLWASENLSKGSKYYGNE